MNRRFMGCLTIIAAAERGCLGVVSVRIGDPFFTFTDDETAGKAEVTENTVRELVSLYSDEKLILAEWLMEQAEKKNRKIYQSI